MLLAYYKELPKKDDIKNIFHIKKIIPLPTEINKNFIDQINRCFIPIASVYKYTLRIVSGFRSVEEQNNIYNQGRTINGHLITEAPGGKSLHNFGFAVDVVDKYRGYNINWNKLGNIAKFCGLEEGIEGDQAHFQYRDNLTKEDFIAGKRPKLLTLPCDIMNKKIEPIKLTWKELKNCGAPNF